MSLNAEKYIFSHGDLEYIATALPSDVNSLRLCGDFDGEIALINEKLSDPTLSKPMQIRLRFEEIIAEEMKKDYLTTEFELFEKLRGKFPDLTEKGFKTILNSGNVDYIYKNGAKYYQNAAYSNIINTHNAFLTGSAPIINVQQHENADIMRKKGFRSFRYTVRHEITLSQKFQHQKSKLLHIYFPYPCECAEQREIILRQSSAPVIISNSNHRTAVMSVNYDPEECYFIEYSYINTAIYREVDPECVYDDGYREYLGETFPQIVFTPYLRLLAQDIAGSINNQYLRARAVYDWVTQNVKYSYVREYFCIDNIPEFAALNRRGDCGVQALLFITLCRILGIPARWQSGWHITPDNCGSHDWAQFYVAPYGWLYADPSFGGGALRNADKYLHEHYFGNLDAERLVTCTDFMCEFRPRKKFLRIDPYDNQSGEAEFEDTPVLWGEIKRIRTNLKTEEIGEL